MECDDIVVDLRKRVCDRLILGGLLACRSTKDKRIQSFPHHSKHHDRELPIGGLQDKLWVLVRKILPS